MYHSRPVDTGPLRVELGAAVEHEARDAQGGPFDAQHVLRDVEGHHHELGRRLLELYATTENEQQVARQAAQRTLELAEEIQEMARIKAGISRAPGC